jgi:hypothetical protein
VWRRQQLGKYPIGRKEQSSGELSQLSVNRAVRLLGQASTYREPRGHPGSHGECKQAPEQVWAMPKKGSSRPKRTRATAGGYRQSQAALGRGLGNGK